MRSVHCLLVYFNTASKKTLLYVLISNGFLEIEDGQSIDQRPETLQLIPVILI